MQEILRFTSSLQLLVQESSVVLFPSLGWESSFNGFDDPSSQLCPLVLLYLPSTTAHCKKKQWKLLCDWGNTESHSVWENENRTGHKPVLNFPFSSLAEGFALLLVNAEQLWVCSTQWLCWREFCKSESSGDSALSQSSLSFEASLLHAVMKSLYIVRTVKKAQKTPHYFVWTTFLGLWYCRSIHPLPIAGNGYQTNRNT